MFISLQNVSYVYKPGTPYETAALKDITVEIPRGQMVGLIGATGSGKSTLVQHLNGLLRPTTGKVLVDGVDVSAKGASLKAIRQKVGLVFQYPEHQLFEETVYQDIAFGPRNMGVAEEDVHSRVLRAMTLVGLDFETFKNRSPFSLSGGQMRRVALAGVLAMQPEVLILDEPTSGLDPRGRNDILNQVGRLHQELGITIILVSHSMEDIARMAERILVMHQGQLVMDGTTREVFSRGERLTQYGLGVPLVTVLMHRLRQKGMAVQPDVITVEEAREELIRVLRGNGHD